MFKRGGAAWTFDMKSRHMAWKWIVEPKAALRRGKASQRTGIQSKRSYRAALNPRDSFL